MKVVTLTVVNHAGLHARPASLLINLLKGYSSHVEFYKNTHAENKYAAKSIVSIMASSVKKGDVLTFEARGEDENKVILAIEDFFNAGCCE